MTRILTILKTALYLAVLGFTAFLIYSHLYPQSIPAAFSSISQLNGLLPAKPCSRPIVYTVGTIDPQFDITRAQFISDLASATNVWNQATGKTLFAYSSTTAPGDLPVSLIYDQREATLLLGNTIDAQQSAADAERAAITQEESRLNALTSAYDAAQAAFTQKVATYQQQVDYWNARGGASGSEYDQLTQEGKDLKAEQAQLNQQADAINSLSDTVQQDVKTFNASVKQTNQQVATFNTEAGNFEQGLYQKDSSGKATITIYAFKNQSELTRTLEHEFGHALGLDHNQNPQSIMYPYIKDITSGPSVDDMAALKKACDF